jgi:hypothetical protein
MMLFRITFAFFVVLSTAAFCLDTASIEGPWSCSTRSAQPDPDFKYVLSCSGTIFFRSGGMFESTCTDAFLPGGSHWKVEGTLLHLTDSEGQVFTTYTWRVEQNQTLYLEKDGVIFTFLRVMEPRPASH